jgi:hypothetical protein
VSKPKRRSAEEVSSENARLREQNAQLRRFGAYHGTTKVCGEVIRALRTVLPWYFIYRAVAAYAGKTSQLTASGALRVESDSLRDALERALTQNSLCALLALFGVLGVIFGYRQLRLRQNLIAHLSPYQQKYELSIDPKRSSSNISPQGETRPGDE